MATCGTVTVKAPQQNQPSPQPPQNQQSGGGKQQNGGQQPSSGSQSPSNQGGTQTQSGTGIPEKDLLVAGGGVVLLFALVALYFVFG